MPRIARYHLPSTRQLMRPGFSGWWMLALAWAAVFFSGPGQTYGVSTFVDPMIAELEMSRSLFSSLYSAGTLCSAIVLMGLGRQIDRWGSRVMLTLAAAGLAVGALTLSVASGPVLILVGFAFIRSFGQGMLNLSARTLVPQWFVRHRGRAFSILGLASTFSLALVPPVHERLIDLFGWRAAWRVDAIFAGLVVVPIFLLFVRNRPEDHGQYPDGERPIDEEARAAATAEAERGLTLNQAFRTFAFWGLIAAGVVPSLVMTGLSLNQISILTDKGLSSSLAASTFAVQSLSGLPVTLAIGWLVDRYPVRYVLVAGQVALGVAMVVLLAADGVALAMVFAVFRGASAALWMVGSDVAWPQYYGRRNLGSIRGFGFGAGVFGAALGPLPFGFAYDRLGGYDTALLALLILPVLAGVAVWFARPPEMPSTATA